MVAVGGGRSRAGVSVVSWLLGTRMKREAAVSETVCGNVRQDVAEVMRRTNSIPEGGMLLSAERRTRLGKSGSQT